MIIVRYKIPYSQLYDYNLQSFMIIVAINPCKLRHNSSIFTSAAIFDNYQHYYLSNNCNCKNWWHEKFKCLLFRINTSIYICLSSTVITFPIVFNDAYLQCILLSNYRCCSHVIYDSLWINVKLTNWEKGKISHFY